MRRTIAVLFLLCALGSAQTPKQAEIKQNVAPKKAQPSATQVSKKPAAENPEQERGRRLLEVAEAQASGLQGGMRAYALWQLARTYERSDKRKTLELLESGMTATREMDDSERATRAQLQQRILQAMVPMAPKRAEELLVQLDADKREPVLNALLNIYEKNNDLDHAIEIVYRIGQEKEIPYEATGRIMAALPAERNGDLLQLFTAAFGSYRDHEHKGSLLGGGGGVGGADLGSLITQFWQKLPPNLVHEAIRELLKQAAASEDKLAISMSGDNGSASFGSYYEYRLFQLLPVLSEIDESEANELLKKNQETKAMLAKYPNGLGSLAPSMASPSKSLSDAAKTDNKPGMRMGTSITIGPSGGSRPPNADRDQARRIMADVGEHPDAALAQAGSISNPVIRGGLYQVIASRCAKENPSVARIALDKLLGTLDQVDVALQLMMMSSAAETYMKMGETEDAKKVIERGFKLAEKLQAQDTNADDPNKALKAYWPSAEAWRSFTRLAARISPDWAITQMNEIPDPEMKGMVQIALAQQWLGVSTGGTEIQSTTKSGLNMMMRSIEGPQ